MTAQQSPADGAVRAALAERRIVPFFQPIVSLKDHKIVGFEVLARWRDPELGDVSPAAFIPLIERDGKLDELLDALMAQALAAAQAWPEDLFLAFNVSPTQLLRPGLPDRIAAVMDAAGAPCRRIHVEVTETAVIEDEAVALATMRSLIDMGCMIAMDDFGTGFSSLTWLRNLPISKIKIDVLFVRSMLAQKESRKIVNAVVGLGHALGLSVVAEGVETVEQAEMLRKIGCGYGQGYLFSAAVPADDVPGLLSALQHKEFSASHARLSLEERAYQISALYRWDDVAIGFLDIQDVIIDASDSFCRLFGLTREQAIGLAFRDLEPPYLDLAQQLIGSRRAGQNRRPLEAVLPSGQTKLLISHDVRDEAGELIGRSVLGVDVTEWRRAALELRHQTERLRFLAETCPSMFWMMTPDGLPVFVSSAWEAVSGMTFEEIAGGKIGHCLHADHRDRVLARWAHCLQTGDVFDMDYLHRLADGKHHWVRCWGTPFRDPRGQIIGWFGTLNVLDPPRSPDGADLDREAWISPSKVG